MSGARLRAHGLGDRASGVVRVEPQLVAAQARGLAGVIQRPDVADHLRHPQRQERHPGLEREPVRLEERVRCTEIARRADERGSAGVRELRREPRRPARGVDPLGGREGVRQDRLVDEVDAADAQLRETADERACDERHADHDDGGCAELVLDPGGDSAEVAVEETLERVVRRPVASLVSDGPDQTAIEEQCQQPRGFLTPLLREGGDHLIGAARHGHEIEEGDDQAFHARSAEEQLVDAPLEDDAPVVESDALEPLGAELPRIVCCCHSLSLTASAGAKRRPRRA